jgi:hypothetical protein
MVAADYATHAAVADAVGCVAVVRVQAAWSSLRELYRSPAPSLWCQSSASPEDNCDMCIRSDHTFGKLLPGIDKLGSSDSIGRSQTPVVCMSRDMAFAAHLLGKNL